MTKSKVLKAHGKQQKEWLTDKLLHSAPSAKLCTVDGKIGAQLEHPKGGPLGWVQSPFGENTLGVFRNDDSKWQWRVKEEYMLVASDGVNPAKIVVHDAGTEDCAIAEKLNGGIKSSELNVFAASKSTGKSKLVVKPYSVWQHKNGNQYVVKEIVNQHTTDPERYPISVVYVDPETERTWCRPLADWYRSMTPL